MEIDEAETKLFCGYCKKPFDRDNWIANETCIHCGSFLDSPPNLFQKRIINTNKIKVSTRWLPRPSNKCPGCYPIGFEKMIKELLGTEDYAHLFSGLAKTGFKIDIRKEVNPDLVADCQDLSMIKDNKFEGAMADPPYTKEFAKKLYGVDYPQWNKWTKEIVRIVKPAGKIGIMQNYVVPKLPKCKYVEILVLINRIKQYPKIVTIQEKLKLSQ